VTTRQPPDPPRPVSPGTTGGTVGTLSTGALTLNNSAGYTFHISNVAGTPGVEWDLLNVSGDISCNASSGNPVTIYLTGNPTGFATCTGDSGGPVIQNEGNPVLVGVVSWGNDRCNGQASRPGVYTKVSAFNGWINCVMQTYSNCASSLPPRRTN